MLVLDTIQKFDQSLSYEPVSEIELPHYSVIPRM
jgi:hypothetical protein